MAVRTLQQQLEDVDAAIARIESNGQDVSINGRRQVQGELAELYKQRARLETKIARTARGKNAVIYLP